MDGDVLYAGDDTPLTAAAYLTCVLEHLGKRVRHIASSARIDRTDIDGTVDEDSGHRLIILSDFPRAHLSLEAEKAIGESVQSGTGFLMIGGWESFSGGGQKYSNGPVSDILPVICDDKDDRRNRYQGYFPRVCGENALLHGLPWEKPPVICGLNRVKPKNGSTLLLEALPLSVEAGASPPSASFRLSPEPLLVIGRYGKGKTAALTTDLAPHWAGGLLDWGDRRLTLGSSLGAQVEVGDAYVEFIGRLIDFLLSSAASPS